jgi:hypothetical protein
VLQAQPQLVTPPSDHTYSPQLTLPTQTSGFVDFNQSLEELPSSVLNMDRDTGSNDDQFSMYWS